MNKRILCMAAGLLLSWQSQITLAAGELLAGTKAFEAKDYQAALKELEPLAKEGNADALNMMGQLYENGWAVEKNIEKAKALYDRGAAKGHIPSVNSLRALKNQEYKIELKTVEPKAKAGEAHAQNRLAQMYEFGQGIDRDQAKAFEWYQKAAKQNLIVAQHNLGRCYNFGTGVKQDFAEAERWYLKAASQGHTDAMFFLGTLYSNDHGSQASESNNIQAYAWMHNASQLGNQTAQAIERRLKMKLTPEQLNKAEALAVEYKVRYITPYQ